MKNQINIFYRLVLCHRYQTYARSSAVKSWSWRIYANRWCWWQRMWKCCCKKRKCPIVHQVQAKQRQSNSSQAQHQSKQITGFQKCKFLFRCGSKTHTYEDISSPALKRVVPVCLVLVVFKINALGDMVNIYSLIANCWLKSKISIFSII